ncbi:MAG TPA: phenylalanine 4-monooxygenase [Gemmatimonadales bacterium]|nr:phenylalanine 4-monooxygenase [Gemmatimonadales bacterium]
MQSATSFFIQQHWSEYTEEHHGVWATLYERRMNALRTTGSRIFLEGADAIGLEPDRVPNLADVNRRLAKLTGWKAVPVSGFLPALDFFACLAERRFPTVVTIRPRTQLDYIEAPDIFHDVFGHVPLHAHPVFAEFLQRFGRIARTVTGEAETERLARLFWFTVEFGLVREEGEIRVFGSGLISSHADANNALGPTCERRPFDVAAVLEQPFVIDRLQNVLFVIDDFGQLEDAVRQLGRHGIPVRSRTHTLRNRTRSP